MAEYSSLHNINTGDFFSTLNNVRSIYLLLDKVLVRDGWTITVRILDFQTNTFDKITRKQFTVNQEFSKRTKTQVFHRLFTGTISGK